MGAHPVKAQLVEIRMMSCEERRLAAEFLGLLPAWILDAVIGSRAFHDLKIFSQQWVSAMWILTPPRRVVARGRRFDML